MPSSQYALEQAAEQAVEQSERSGGWSEPTVDPLAPLEHLIAWMMSTALHVSIGVALGVVAANVMRRCHLRWTWAATALALVVITRQELAGWAATLGTASLCASVRSQATHAHDVRAGADLAEIAAMRRGPLDALRSLAHRAWRHRWQGASAGRIGEPLVLGCSETGEPVSIPLGGCNGGTHTLVVGAAGSGKTVTQTLIVMRAIERGMGAIVIDPKHDRRMREAIADAARAAGRPFIEWTPEGPSVYNPYARGSATEIADKALAGERFTEPHYLRQAQRYLGHEVRVLRKAGLEVSLDTLVRHLDPGALEQLARSLPEGDAETTYEYLDSLTARQQADLSGVRDRLAIMAESDIAAWLDPRTSDVGSFELLEAIRARAVVYFSMESDRRPLLANMLGVAIVLDLQTAIAALQSSPVPTVVVIDEFSAIATEHVTRLFARARSAGISLVLGTQELSDMRVPGREMVYDQVSGNLSALIAHRQVVPESADTISRLAGTVPAWRTSHSSDGRWTRTRNTAPVIAPDLMRGLPPGWAVVITFGADRGARVTRILQSEGRTR